MVRTWKNRLQSLAALQGSKLELIGMNMYELYNGRSPQIFGTGTLFWVYNFDEFWLYPTEFLPTRRDICQVDETVDSWIALIVPLWAKVVSCWRPAGIAKAGQHQELELLNLICGPLHCRSKVYLSDEVPGKQLVSQASAAVLQLKDATSAKVEEAHWQDTVTSCD